MSFKPGWSLVGAIVITTVLVRSSVAFGATAGNPLCPGEEVLFNPGNGEDIVVPDGFNVSVFAKGLNFPTGIAFRGDSQMFEVYILESGGIPASRCNDPVAWQASGQPGRNPFTPDILVLDRTGAVLRMIGKATDATTGGAGTFPPGGPVIDIAFEHGFGGGRLFATEGSVGTIATVDPTSGKITPLIAGVPVGQLAFREGWIYWGGGRDDEQCCHQPFRPPIWSGRYTVPRHYTERQRVCFGRWRLHQRLFSFRSAKQGRDGTRLLQWNNRERAHGCLQWRGATSAAAQSEYHRALLMGLSKRLCHSLCP
jgi:hypothetical protein